MQAGIQLQLDDAVWMQPGGTDYLVDASGLEPCGQATGGHTPMFRSAIVAGSLVVP